MRCDTIQNDLTNCRDQAALTHSIHFCVWYKKMCPIGQINASAPHPLSIQIMGFNGAGPLRAIHYEMGWGGGVAPGWRWGVRHVLVLWQKLCHNIISVFDWQGQIVVLIRVRLHCRPSAHGLRSPHLCHSVQKINMHSMDRRLGVFCLTFEHHKTELFLKWHCWLDFCLNVPQILNCIFLSATATYFLFEKKIRNQKEDIHIFWFHNSAPSVAFNRIPCNIHLK